MVHFLKSLSIFVSFFSVYVTHAADDAIDPSLLHRMGKIIKCPNEAALKAHYLNQLQSHEVYGNPDQIHSESAQNAALFYQNKRNQDAQDGRGPLLSNNLFNRLNSEMIFDGAQILNNQNDLDIPKTGDIFLNLSFLHDQNQGAFYSKRGMIHARIVVGSFMERGVKKLILLDGGWQQLSVVSQINSQVVWLRPKAELFSEEDAHNLIKWSLLFAPSPYDNQLIDNLQSFRDNLNQSIDSLSNSNADNDFTANEIRLTALKRQLSRSEAKDRNDDGIIDYAGYAPFGASGRDHFIPDSGFYCSESGTDIYTYLGYRLYGEVPFEVVTAFSSEGKLPSWEVYENALGGFGADQGPVRDMHFLYYNYFLILDSAWKLNLIQLPPYVDNYNEANFVEAMTENINSALSRIPFGEDQLLVQLNELIRIARQNTATQELAQKAIEVRDQIFLVMTQLNAQRPENTEERNFTKTVEFLFFLNKAYGPHHFLENSSHFDLKGISYNSDLQGGYQAAWVFNYHPNEGGNKSTTLYEIDPSVNSCTVTNTTYRGSRRVLLNEGGMSVPRARQLLNVQN